MKIDFDKKKSEEEWLTPLHKFFLAATPKWFNWLGWVFILGALSILAEKSQSMAVTIIYAISFIFFMNYFMIYFYQFEFHNLPFIRNNVVAGIISILFTALLGAGLFLLFNSLAHSLNINGT